MKTSNINVMGSGGLHNKSHTTKNIENASNSNISRKSKRRLRSQKRVNEDYRATDEDDDYGFTLKQPIPWIEA